MSDVYNEEEPLMDDDNLMEEGDAEEEVAFENTKKQDVVYSARRKLEDMLEEKRLRDELEDFLAEDDELGE